LASIRVGNRTDVESGMSERAWVGSDRLGVAIAKVRAKIGARARLSIVAYSQGTVLTLRALQDLHKDILVDNVVFMGSTLSETIIENGDDNTRLADAMNHVRGTFVNLASSSDDVLDTFMANFHLTPSGCIGSRSLPGPIANFGVGTQVEPNLIEWKVKEKRMLSISLSNVEHNGDTGWWSMTWHSNASKGSSAEFVGEKRFFALMP
jgi:hypothetical protein